MATKAPSFVFDNDPAFTHTIMNPGNEAGNAGEG